MGRNTQNRFLFLLVTCAAASLAPSCAGPSSAPASGTLYAPESLASALPAQVNGKVMNVGEYRSEDAATMLAEAPEAFRLYLLDIGKQPTDVVGASAYSEPEQLADGRPTQVFLIALRIRGVLADQVMAGLVANTSPQPSLRPETVAGRQVYAVIRAAPEPLYLYAKGEVLFVVGATPADVASSEADAQAALAALP